MNTSVNTVVSNFAILCRERMPKWHTYSSEVLENPTIKYLSSLEHYICISQGILLVLFCSLTAVVK